MTPPPPADDGPALSDTRVLLPGGPTLAVRTAPGPLRPYLLVHGLASNARLWDGVARRLAAAGHQVVAVDQRGHGRSEAPEDGYGTPQAARDLAQLLEVLGLTGERRPVVAGQSWGGNVVLELAARHPEAVAALALVDGGWLRLGPRFATFEECWEVLAPPVFDGMRMADLRARITAMASDWPAEGVAGTLANLRENPDGTVRAILSREHHREILRSLWELDPLPSYPGIEVPVLLLPAVPPADDPSAAVRRAAVQEAADLLPDARISWYEGAHHDLHAQRPARTAADLLALAARVDRPSAPTTALEAS